MAKVVVYTAQFCPYCISAKALLKRRDIPFEEKLISYDDEAVWDELQKKSGMQTVPQIFVDGEILGGYTELAARDAEDQLASLK